jgi:alpha-L-fucosidase
MNPISIRLKSFLILLWISGNVVAQSTYTLSDVNKQNREWFQSARFGLFIHWGVYSVLGDGEWVMNQQQIPIRDYEKLPAFFNPTAFDAKSWV